MPVTGPVSEQLLTLVAAATVFAVMFDLGLGIVPREFRWVLQSPGLLLRGLFAVLVAVPVVALVVVRALDLPRGVEIGIVLMAISPGAPVPCAACSAREVIARLPRLCRSSSRPSRPSRCRRN